MTDPPPMIQGWPVKLVPEHRQVEAIARQIKASGRAFSVFDVGRLFMQSRDRYHVRFTKQAAPPPAQAPTKPKEGAPATPPPPAAPSGPRGPEELLQCVADGSLWLTRDEAIRHLLNSPALTKYYRAETVTLDAPKGNWTAVAVCGFSGALLGPPNHHDFQRNVARLHRERFSDMSLDRYKSRIRTEKDEALLQKWQESQSTATQYVPVAEESLPEGTEPPAPLKSVAEMEAHFLRTHAATAVNAVTTATVPGNIPGKYLSPALLNLLRREVESQQRFPMQLVQDLCRDLENQGLRFFKRDRKTTFVCRNRPHFLPDDLVLSDRIRAMVEMVRANPGLTYSRLVSTLAPHIARVESPAPAARQEAPAPAAEESSAAVAEAPTAERPTPEAPVVDVAVVSESVPVGTVEVEAPEARVEISSEPTVAAEAEAAAEVPAAETASESPAADAPVSFDAPAGEAAAIEAPAATSATEPVAETPEADEAPAAEAPPAAESPAPQAAPAPVQHLSPEEIAILQDLHWLVQEGYVTEFQNGELFVLGRPPLPPVEKKPRPQRPQKPAGEPSPGPQAPGETNVAEEQPPSDAGSSGEAPPAPPEAPSPDAAPLAEAVPESPSETAEQAQAENGTPAAESSDPAPESAATPTE